GNRERRLALDQSQPRSQLKLTASLSLRMVFSKQLYCEQLSVNIKGEERRQFVYVAIGMFLERARKIHRLRFREIRAAPRLWRARCACQRSGRIGRISFK